MMVTYRDRTRRFGHLMRMKAAKGVSLRSLHIPTQIERWSG